jgi:hypothetical protein
MFSLLLFLLSVLGYTLASNEPGKVWEASCRIIGEALGDAQELYPCLDVYENDTKKAERDNRFELVTRTAKPLLNNRYSYQAIIEAGSCMMESTPVKCKPTLDTLSRYTGLTCRSANTCTLSKSSSTTMTMSSHDSSGSSISMGQISFSKQGGSDSSISRTIDESISLTINPNETLTIYTFSLMKRCSFKCQGVDQEVLTWQGDRRGEQISIYYSVVHNEEVLPLYGLLDQTSLLQCPEPQLSACNSRNIACTNARTRVMPRTLGCKDRRIRCTITCGNNCKQACEGCLGYGCSDCPRCMVN